jgi:hypothetical protein
LKLWTPTVDVSNGPAEAILQITAQDDNSGLALSQWSATIGQFGSVSSDYWPPTPTAGTVSDFNVTLQFGPYIAPSPTYQLNAMIRDVADNVVFFDSLQLAALGFSSTIAIVNANPDVQAPKVFNFSATTPTKVNASSTAPVKVSFAIEVEDTMFGTKSIRLQAVDKGLRTYASDVIFNSPPVVGRRTCTLTLEFAANPKPMVYNLLLGVADEGWNSMAYDANALSKLGFPSIVQVVSAVDKADVTAPILLNLTALSPLVVNYSATFPPEVNFELSALDDQSGIWVACLRASHINETLSACRGEIRTPITDVFYERPRFLFNPKAWGYNPAFWREKPGSFRGVYNLSVYLRDDVDNEMTISSDELVARGFPGSFTVV